MDSDILQELTAINDDLDNFEDRIKALEKRIAELEEMASSSGIVQCASCGGRGGAYGGVMKCSVCKGVGKVRI